MSLVNHESRCRSCWLAASQPNALGALDERRGELFGELFGVPLDVAPLQVEKELEGSLTFGVGHDYFS